VAVKAPFIQTPRGFVTTDRNGKASLEWNSGAFNGGGDSWNNRYSDAQKFVDSEVLRLCEPYIPLLTGVLKFSGILGTDVGSGTVSWITPYARKRYYTPRKTASTTGPLRGPFWFERMKQAHGREIVAGARKIAGGK
jgi:hypothetical protein